MSKIQTASIFPRHRTTAEKVNITSLTIAMAELSKDETLEKIACEMVNSLYSKTRARAFRRASAVIAVLRSHDL